MSDIGPYIRTDCNAVDKRDEMRSVMAWITGDTNHLPVVMDDGRPFGMMNERALMMRRLDPRTKVANYAVSAPPLSKSATFEEAMSRMAECRASNFPVESESGHLEGYVRALDLLRERQGEKRTAAELCVPVKALHAHQTMGDARHAFHQEYVDHLPVMDGNGKLAGVVSRRALLRLGAITGHGRGRKDAGGEKRDSHDGRVDGFLDVQTPVVDANASYAEVIEAVDKMGFAVVQTADGRVVGVVTPETLVRSATT